MYLSWRIVRLNQLKRKWYMVWRCRNARGRLREVTVCPGNCTDQCNHSVKGQPRRVWRGLCADCLQSPPASSTYITEYISNQMLDTMQGVRVMENKYHSSTRDAAPARPLRYCHFPKNWRDVKGNHKSQALDTELQDLVFALLALSYALMQFLLSLLLSALEDVCLHF